MDGVPDATTVGCPARAAVGAASDTECRQASGMSALARMRVSLLTTTMRS